MPNLENKPGKQLPYWMKRIPITVTRYNELIITDPTLSDHAKKLARTYDPKNSPRVTEAERKILDRSRKT